MFKQLTLDLRLLIAENELQNSSYENEPLDAMYILELRYKHEAKHLYYCKICQQGEVCKMAIPVKHRQHYVFQAYLKEWTKNDQIWCFRDGKKFLTNTINIAQERDFYRVLDANDDEKRFLSMFWYKQPNETEDILRKQMELYETPIRWKKYVKNMKTLFESTVYQGRPLPKEYCETLAKAEQFIEDSTNNLIEDQYSDEEGKTVEMLQKLKQGDMSFYYEPKSEAGMAFHDTMQEFLYHFCSQYVRTKAMRTRLLKSLKSLMASEMIEQMGMDEKNIRPAHLTHHILWYTACKLADTLYEIKAHMTLLSNNTTHHFITGDQPILNLNADYQDQTDQVDAMIFYYPISQTRAITVNDSNSENTIELSIDDVDYYNRKIAAASYEAIYADSSSMLDHCLTTP